MPKAIPDYGVHMSLKEFIDGVESSCLTDYDGHGYLATSTEMSDVVVPFRVHRLKQLRQEGAYTHVVWFNK